MTYYPMTNLQEQTNKIIQMMGLNESKSTGWNVINGKLNKKFKFDSYSNVLKFVQKVGDIAEKQNHHPEMVVKYNEVIVTMFDHEKNKISDRCHKFADSVNKINLK